MFDPKQAKLVGLSLLVTEEGAVAVDLDCVGSVKMLKDVLNSTLPEWEGQEILCDMVDWLKEELQDVERRFMKRYDNETVRL